MEGNSDIIDKLKASVIAKLEELDPSTNRDATLIDYIIVMIVNQKSKFEMKHNLSLFLGKIVDEFVNWLFDYLATTSELKVKTASPTAAAVLNATTSTSSSSSSRTTTKNSPKSTSSPKETEKSKKSEPIADSKANTATITNGHSSSSSSQEATSKGDPSKKSTSRRKLKSAVSASSTDDKETTAETGVATSPVNTTNNNNNNSSSTADATTNTTASSPTRKNGKVVKRRPAAEAVSYASGSRKRTQSNSATTDNINDEEMGGGGSGAKKSRQKKGPAAVDDDEEDVEMLGLDADSKENNETKFLITLDGAKDMFKDTQDGLLLDEDFDPELMNEDLSNFGGKNYSKNSGNGSSNGSPSKNNHHHHNGVSHSLADMSAMITESNGGGNSKSTERCKYWPACLNGDQCEFFHPVTKCNNFPYCRFGDKCLYIHPTCKFDSYCTRKDCNFMHTAKVRGPPMHQMYPSTVRHHHPMMMYGGMGMGMGMGMPPMSTSNVTCKFFPNCMKPACEFFHPKVCHYGAACTSVNCPFVHLPSQAVAPVLPSALAPAAPTAVAALHTSKFKWSSSRKAAAASAMDEF